MAGFAGKGKEEVEEERGIELGKGMKDKGGVREGKAPWREGEWVVTVGFSQCLYKYFEGCCTNKRGTTES